MKRTMAYFKFTLRSCRATEDLVHFDSIAWKLLGKQTKHFWKEVNKVKGGLSTTYSASVQKNISALWKGHYEKILNSYKSTHLKEEALKKLQSCTVPETLFTPAEIASVIKYFKNRKASEQDILQSEHFKHGSEILFCAVKFII